MFVSKAVQFIKGLELWLHILVLLFAIIVSHRFLRNFRLQGFCWAIWWIRSSSVRADTHSAAADDADADAAPATAVVLVAVDDDHNSLSISVAYI